MSRTGLPSRGGGATSGARPMHVLLLCLVAVSTACSPRRVAEAFLLGDHFLLTTDVTYGDGPRQRLDVYRPRAAPQARPVVIFLYGGRWQGGSREDYRLVGDALTRRGIVAVIPDYRLYPEAIFPAWIDDGARAVKWTLENIHRFGGDPRRVILVGHSAGAHTVALLGLDERYLERAGAAGRVRGFVALAGPVDTVWTDPDVQALMGPEPGWPVTYPASHVDGREPPLLLLHGAGDRTVASHNSIALAALIRERGGCARAVVYPKVGHIEIVVALAVPRLGLARVMDEVVAFVEEPRRRACPEG